VSECALYDIIKVRAAICLNVLFILLRRRSCMCLNELYMILLK